MSAGQVVFIIYSAGVLLSFIGLVERDEKKATREDAAMSGVLALGWPITLVLCVCLLAYVITHGDSRRRP